MVQNEKLTAEGIASELTVSYGSPTLYRIQKRKYADKIAAFAAQQVEHATAELRDVINAWKDAYEAANKYSQLKAKQLEETQVERNNLQIQVAELRKELEAGSKNKHVADQVDELRADLKFNREQREVERIKNESLQREIKYIKTQLAEAQRHRDEYKRKGALLFDELITVHSQYGDFNHALEMSHALSEWHRLSSGEKKPASPWVSVKERPLVVKTETGWIATPDGDGEFLAAVPYTDKRQHGEFLWWIRHCVIDDDMGLCVVGDDDNAPAGWSVEDVDFFQPLPAPPESLTDNNK